jgi:hypothetical protein
MNTEIRASTEVSDFLLTQKSLLSFLDRKALDHLDFLADSSSFSHLPVLFWLLEALRPRTMIKLGVGDGVAYFAVCQAMADLVPGGQCYGVDGWADNEGVVPTKIEDHNARVHYGRSELIDAEPWQAASRFADGSVDLLFIDTGLDTDKVESLRSNWLTKIAPGGALLFADRMAIPDVEALLTGLHAEHAVLKFGDDDGIFIVLLAPLNASLLRVANADAQQRNEIGRLFRFFGSRYRIEWSSQQQSQRANYYKKKLGETESRISRLEEEYAKTKQKLVEREEAYDTRSGQIAELQAALFDIESARADRGDPHAMIEGLQEQVGAQEAEIAAQIRAITDRNLELARMREVAEIKDSERVLLERALAERLNEIVVLTQKAETLRESAEKEQLQLRNQIVKKDRKFHVLLEKANWLRREREAMLQSTSWKMTAPIRGIVRLVRRRR